MASDADAAIAAAAIASGAVALSVAGVAGACHRRRGDGGAAIAAATASAVTTAVPSCVGFGLIGCGGGVIGSCLLAFRRTSHRRTSAHRTSIWSGGRVGLAVGSASAFASALASSRALSAASRSFESLRAALSWRASEAALSDAAVLSRERLSERLANRRRGAGRAVAAPGPARDCRCCWRPYCCRPARRSCRFGRMGRNPTGQISLPRPEKMRLPILLT